MRDSCTVTLTIDWSLLRDQKLRLLKACSRQPGLDGLVELIDSIQDQASAQGCAVQWLTDSEESHAND
jgi:hypothetical protein